MKREPLDEEIKVRVPSSLKSLFATRAHDEDLELSDIVRRALKEYAKKVTASEPEYASAA